MSIEIPCLVGNGACPAECPGFEIAKTVYENLSTGNASGSDMVGIFGDATPGNENDAVACATDLCIKEVPTSTNADLYEL
jgi:hypothetical protein